ncbi:MAG: class I tRNA ligase family protein, partial [Clostridia bacterium]
STIRPWVMGSCKHLAIAKNLRYDLVEVKDKDKIIHYIIAEECSDIVMQSAFYIKYNVKETFDAIDLIDFVCFNPLDYNKTVDVISSENEYIMYDKKNNTGINIVSSGHTYFDYLILEKEHNDELHTIVDEDGKLNSQSLVYTGDNYLEANTKIVGFLKEFDFVFSTISIKTNIQKCRMCNETLIYRTLNEWYMTKIQGDKLNDITVNNIKSKLISYDEYLNSELDATVTKVNNIVESAISDEKVLGTPIPVFYCADCGKVVLNDVTINILKHLFSTKGSDMWYKMAPEEILRGQASCVCGCGFLFKENSTINDFFKMFCMSFNTKDRSICIENKEIFNDKLKALSFTQNPEKEFENVEQIVIHSSVYEDTKTIAKPLFFIKDDVEDRNELMKKEIGIHDIVKKYGTDVLRLWVLSVSNNKKIKLNEQSIIQTNKIYNNIRKTFKYLMSNVYDFNPFKDNVKVSDRTDLDKYMFVKLRSFSKVINAYFDKFDFKNVYTELVRFCTQDLCKTYFEMIKYDLYILNANDKQRRSIQSTMYDILYTLLLISEPILPFTVEEIWPLIWHKTTDEEKNTLLFKYQLPIVANTYEEETKKYNNIIFIRNNLNKYIRKAIEDKVISNSMQAKVVITTNDNTRLFIEANYEEIIRATNISSIDAKTMLVHKIIVIKEPGDKCARCGRNNISIGVDLKYRYLCPNCVKILNKK